MTMKPNERVPVSVGPASYAIVLRYHLAMPTRKTDGRTYPTVTRAEAEAWRDLHRQLARARTIQDAKDIAAQTAPPHAKRFYTHLRSFVRTLKPPRRGTRSELYVYGKLRLRFANGSAPVTKPLWLKRK
jgi:hypothetical protein